MLTTYFYFLFFPLPLSISVCKWLFHMALVAIYHPRSSSYRLIRVLGVLSDGASVYVVCGSAENGNAG